MIIFLPAELSFGHMSNNANAPPDATPLQRMKVLAHEFLCVNFLMDGKTVCCGKKYVEVLDGYILF